MVRPTSSCTEKLLQIGKENEDSKGFSYLSRYDGGISRNMAKKPAGAGVKRSCGKNCRIRWNNNQIENNFSPEEEDLIIKLHSTIGSRWTIIAQQLPGRTDNEVKNFWNKKLKKKLTAVGIDPITHRPFSQILADYGNINNGGGFNSHKSRNHFFGGLKKTEHQYNYSLHKKSDFSSDFSAHFDSRISCLQESSQDHIFTKINSDPNNNNTSSSYDNGIVNGKGNSFDLLSQLQAISMVTDYNSSRKNNSCFQETLPFDPVSDQLATTTNKSIASSSSFSWCDFLLEDEFLPVNDDGEEQDNGTGIIINEVSNKTKKEQQQQPAAADEEEVNDDESNTLSNRRTAGHHEDYTVVSGGSFVEAILETETDEMLSDFHGFLDEPF